MPEAARASTTGVVPAGRDPWVPLAWAAIVAWVAFEYLRLAHVPLLADDHVHVAAARGWRSLGDVWQALPPRPLQHLLFAFGDLCGASRPECMRAVGAALHLGAVVMVGAVARGFGLTARRAVAAAALFACFPAVRSAFWPAAVNSPGRLCATLVVLWAFQRIASRPRATAALAGTCVALGFHQTAVMLPALLAVQAWALRGARAADVVPAARDLARTPMFWAVLALVGAAAAWFRSVPDQHHAARSWSSLAANTAWFATGLWPEAWRLAALDALRGHGGAGGTALGLAALACFGALVLWWLVRGGALVRFAVGASAVDMLLPAATAGWTLRHMVPSAAFVAIAAAGSARGRLGAGMLAAVTIAWLHDSVAGMAEFRAAGELSARLVQQTADVRRQLPASEDLYVVDVPFAFGRAQDVPFANWGFVEAVYAAGGAGHLVQLYSAPQRASTAARVASPAEIEELKRRATVLAFDAATATLVLHRDGRRQEPR